jgi:uncharacterized protein (DUF924 family)
MAGDLGVAGGEVHAQAVLDFWFWEVSPDKRFARDDALDRTIAARFGPMRDAVLVSRADGWRDDPDAILAAIILLDQFSRNIHRGKDEAFAGDRLALALARLAIAMGWDASLDPERRAFLYMPLMHAEDSRSQELSLACFGTLGSPEDLQYAREHADVIAQFGRFPSRNAALRRRSTPEEQAWLSRPCAGW